MLLFSLTWASTRTPLLPEDFLGDGENAFLHKNSSRSYLYWKNVADKNW